MKRQDQKELLLSEGIENVIVTEGDWKESYYNITKEMQSDILIDSLGTGETFDALLRGLIPGGLIVIIGGL